MKSKLILLLLFIPVILSAQKKRQLVWVLDAGHGGKDPGCELPDLQEKNITLNITKEVARLLRDNKPGIRVILTRKKDEFITLADRCQRANSANADLFLSIHVNFAPNNRLLQGTETFYASTRRGDNAVLQSARVKNADKSELLAWLMQKSYYDAGRVADRGAKSEHLYVLMHTMMPAALTEVGFMSNIQEQGYLRTERGQKEIAACIYDALNEYYTTTQAKTHKETLKKLRLSNGTSSGLNCTKLSVRKEPYVVTNSLKEDYEEPAQENGKKNDFPPGFIPEVFTSSYEQEEESQSQAEFIPELAENVNPQPDVISAEEENAQMEVVPKPTEQKSDDIEPIIPEPVRREMEQKEPIIPEPVKKEMEQKEPIIPEPVKQGQAEKEPIIPAPEQKPAQQETTQPEPAKQEKPSVAQKEEKAESKAQLVFSIQIVNVSAELKQNDERLKGLSPVTFIKSGNTFKGLYGGTTDYKKAKETLTKVRKTFPDAFIVAYLGEEAIPMAKALEMIKK